MNLYFCILYVIYVFSYDEGILEYKTCTGCIMIAARWQHSSKLILTGYKYLILKLNGINFVWHRIMWYLIYYVLATITKFNMEMCDKKIG